MRVQAQRELDELRDWIAHEPRAGPAEVAARIDELAVRLAGAFEADFGRPLARVLNATGIYLHTNLGRSPLPRAVATALPELLDASCDLELDLATGRRGQRNRRVARLLCALTGAEAALAVNNNAAAVFLVLTVLAAGREVVISRGELIEIGGSFRIPEILRAAGAQLIEVGTTNRTRLADYETAIRSQTALLLKVVPSNYRVRGFTSAVGAAELARLGRERGVAVVVDEGSGLLRPHPAPQLADHPSFQTLLAAGCDLVCGSGDKLLGGPQAGLLAGRRELVEPCHRHPLYRVLRPDRAAYAALEAVLRLHLCEVPLPLARLWPDAVEHRRRVESAAARVGGTVVEGEAFIGGGSAPDAPIPGAVLALAGGDELVARLRAGHPPVIGYLREGRVILDLRTVDAVDDEELLRSVEAACRAS